MNSHSIGSAPRRAGRRDFGSVYTDGTPTDPAFSVMWQEGSRRRRKRGFRTRTDAAAYLARVRAGMGDGTLATARRAEALFVDVGAEWLELHSKALRSHRENEIRWNLRIKGWFAGLTLAAVTPAKVLAFKAHVMADEDLADATRNQYLQEVRAVLRYAVAAGYLGTSPTERVRGFLIPLRREKLAPPIERPEDVGRFLEAFDRIAADRGCPSFPALFATAAYTGLRRGELCGLQWSDVDLERRTIVVRRSYAGPTKSGKGRLVPMPPSLVAILAAWKLQSGGGSGLVFPDDKTGEMYTPKGSAPKLTVATAAGCKATGLKKIRFHDLRHTFASHYLMAGGDLFTLQRILGHSSPAITSEVYGHLAQSHLVKESDRLRFDAPACVVLRVDGSA